MTLIRPIDRPGNVPTPLDIASLRVGPPLDADGEADTGVEERPRTRDLVALRDERGLPAVTGDTRRRRDEGIDTEVEALLAPERRARVGQAGGGVHVRHMTPREMLTYSEDLYAAGIVTFDDYEAMAFQPDLHPDFKRTIGALTGDVPQPDRPRDFIRRWEDRLDFARRYHPANSHEVRQAYRILNVLKTFQRRGDIFG